MSRIDDRIREEMNRLTRPVDSADAFSRISMRKRHRRVVRRAQVVLLAAAVVGGTAVGGYGLAKLFGVADSSHPAHPPTPRPSGSAETSPGLRRSPEPTRSTGASKAARRRAARESASVASIAEAVAFLQKNVEVRVVLPRPLPPRTRLVKDPVGLSRFGNRVNARLTLRFGTGGILHLQYGVALFDGCGADAAHATTIRGRRALVYTAPRGPWTEVIWPATPAHPEGRYGVAGTLTLPQAVAMAESMEAARARLQRVEVGC